MLAPDGKSLLSVKTNDGTLWRIPFDEAEPVVEIPLTAPVTHGDGLVWTPSGSLLVMQNYEEKVSDIDMGSGRVTDLLLTGIETPTSAAFSDGGDLVVVNSQFARDLPVCCRFRWRGMTQGFIEAVNGRVKRAR